MEYTYLLNISIILVLLGLSGFFSSSETSLFSLGRVALEKIKRERPGEYKNIQFLISQPRKTLISLLVGNELINISFSVFFASIVFKVFDGKVSGFFLPFLPIFLALPILLFFGEIIPKTVAISAPDRVAGLNARWLRYFSYLINPVRTVIKIFSDFFARPFLGKKGKQDTIIDEDYFKSVVEIGTEEGTLDEIEKDMIERVFVLDDILIEQIFTPYSKVASIPADITYTKLIEFIKRERYSRIPVHSEKDDKTIIGILRIKELLGFRFTGEAEFKQFLSESIQKPLFVPPKKRVIDVLREFQLTKIHMGIVVDEYGKMKGVITMEDLLEELFGEIKDEYDIEEALYRRLEDGGYRFDLRVTAGRFSEMLNYELPEGNFSNLEQLLTVLKNGEKPANGDVIETKGRILNVKEENKRLVVYARVEVKPD